MAILTRIRLLFLVSLAATFLGCSTTSTTSSTTKETPGQYVDDSMITTKVKTAILKEPNLKVTQINVQTYKGKVQLSGFVDSAESAKRAGAIAGSVEGVTSVENNLIVK